jgi:hypothetical protein
MVNLITLGMFGGGGAARVINRGGGVTFVPDESLTPKLKIDVVSVTTGSDEEEPMSELLVVKKVR